MRRSLAFVLLFGLAHAAASAQNDPLAPLRFLLGEWRAFDGPAGESGASSFKLTVQGHVMLRTNEATYAATAERPASRHEDLLVVYQEDGSLKADYFDTEGHVIRYGVKTPQPNTVVFVSDGSAREPGYRLIYRAAPDGVLLGTFEIAPPGSPGAFKPYLSWKARRP